MVKNVGYDVWFYVKISFIVIWKFNLNVVLLESLRVGVLSDRSFYSLEGRKSFGILIFFK